MTRSRSIPLLCLVLAAAAPRAQEEASTLAALVARADAIASVRILASQEAGGTVRVVRARVLGAWKGEPPALLDLREPAQDGCGRALRGLFPGAGYLLFLERFEGAWRPAQGQARALEPLDAELLAHLKALLQAEGTAARTAVLAAGLGSGHARVRGDAALALAAMPMLDEHDPVLAGAVVAALGPSIDERSAAALPLLRLTQRLRSAPAIDVVLPRVLEGRAGPFAAVALQTLAALPAELVARRTAERMPADGAGRRRAVEVLAMAPCRATQETLLRLLREVSLPGAERAAEVLLQMGVPAELVQAAAPQGVAERARGTQERPPRFRAIRPHDQPGRQP